MSSSQCDLCHKVLQNSHGLLTHKGKVHKNVPAAPPASTQQNRLDLSDEIQLLRKSSRIIRCIPHNLRIVIAQELTQVLRKCASSNTVEAWTRLLTFAHRVLDTSSLDNPKKPALQRSQEVCEALRDNLRNWQNRSSAFDLAAAQPKSRRTKEAAQGPDERLARIVEQKLFDGDVTGAVRLLSSSDTITAPSHETRDALVLKHLPLAAPLNPPYFQLYLTSLSTQRKFPLSSAVSKQLPAPVRMDTVHDTYVSLRLNKQETLVSDLSRPSPLLLTGCSPVRFQ